MAMRMPLRKQYRLGFTVLEVMVVTTIISSMPTGDYRGLTDRANEIKCQQQMRQIGMVLMASGALPNAAFYPKGNPMEDPQSLLVLLKRDLPEEIFTCPSMPPALAEKGLTFVWNDKLNGQQLLTAGRTWVMIEMSCLAAKPVAPHSGKFNILYTDGSVKSVTEVPEEIKEALAEALKKMEGIKPKEDKARPGLAGLNTGTPPAPKSAGQPENPPPSAIKKGDQIAVTKDQTELFLKGQSIGVLGKGQKLEVVEVRGEWVGVNATIDGQQKTGWVKITDVGK